MVTVKEELEMMVVLNITENREKESREIDRRSSCTSECLSSLVSSLVSRLSSFVSRCLEIWAWRLRALHFAPYFSMASSAVHPVLKAYRKASSTLGSIVRGMTVL